LSIGLSPRYVDTASRDTASRDTASRDTASRDTASTDTASRDTASRDPVDLNLNLPVDYVTVVTSLAYKYC
jgi:hypothetical protein